VCLAAGNYCNGNTNRGQADGFEMSDLPKFDTIKDNLNEKHKMTRWCLTTFLTHERCQQARDNFEAELGPVFVNVKRRMGKSKGDPGFREAG